jgi:hypothetical protein
MGAVTSWIHENWLWWTVFLTVIGFLGLFFRGLSRLKLERLAKLSIRANVIYIFLSLVFRRQLMPSSTPAFPILAQSLLTLQFAMAGMAFVRPIDKLCKAKPGGETDVENISVTNPLVSENRPLTGWKSISRSEWLWTGSTVASFISMMVILSFLRTSQIFSR